MAGVAGVAAAVAVVAAVLVVVAEAVIVAAVFAAVLAIVAVAPLFFDSFVVVAYSVYPRYHLRVEESRAFPVSSFVLPSFGGGRAPSFLLSSRLSWLFSGSSSWRLFFSFSRLLFSLLCWTSSSHLHSFFSVFHLPP